jgi:GDPmannose 4,6-dehydratase
MMETHAIIGAGGQDGRLLGHALAARGHHVIPLTRGDLDLWQSQALRSFLAERTPDTVWFLAAYHHSSEDAPDDDTASVFRESFRIHCDAPILMMEQIASVSPRTRFFYAGSSHMFGQTASVTASEQTPFVPSSPYAISKTAGVHACRHFRKARGVFASCGILFNHESPLRAPRFVSQKIARAAQAIAAGQLKTLTLGDLDAAVDWGDARDTIDAIQRIMALPEPGDFVVATGKTHTVREFVEIAFSTVGLDWREHVRSDPALLRRATGGLAGDSSKLRRATGWTPRIGFADMVRHLVTSPAIMTQEAL